MSGADVQGWNDADVTGLILAGGHSRRFGADKCRFLVDGRPMIVHVHAAISSVCRDVVISLGSETEEFPLTGVRYVRDHLVDAGPLAAIQSAMHVIETPWVLAVACDMPYITPDALHRLLRARREGVRAVIATDADGRLHPLCACYRLDILPQLTAYLAAGRRSALGFVDELVHVEVELEVECVRNINSPGDLSSS